MSAPAPLVRIVRSGLEESVHHGHVAVCDVDGRILAAVGDPRRRVFARSSMKPLQAAVSLRRIDDPIAEDLVAIACASHNGEPDHVRAVRRLLRAGGLTEAAIRCPPALPSRGEDARRVGRPRRVFHNCSGKHAAMVVAAEAGGWGHSRASMRSVPFVTNGNGRDHTVPVQQAGGRVARSRTLTNR